MVALVLWSQEIIIGKHGKGKKMYQRNLQCPGKIRNFDYGVQIIWKKFWFWTSRSSGKILVLEGPNHLEKICIWTTFRSSGRRLNSGGDPNPLVFHHLEMVQILCKCASGNSPDPMNFASGGSAQTLWILPLGEVPRLCNLASGGSVQIP